MDILIEPIRVGNANLGLRTWDRSQTVEIEVSDVMILPHGVVRFVYEGDAIYIPTSSMIQIKVPGRGKG